jgi:hypothetical protein
MINWKGLLGIGLVGHDRVNKPLFMEKVARPV